MALLSVPTGSFLFGLRTWIAMVLALLVAFWLQIDGAGTAATGVAILALPTRGSAADKAAWRLAGTIIGASISIAIAGACNGVNVLFIALVGAWLSCCVFAANMLGGNRAYAAVLSGYTVAIVAVADIDVPGATFVSGVNRTAAILIAICAVAFVNDLTRAPAVFAGLKDRISVAHRDVRSFSLDCIQNGAIEPVAIARLLARIVRLHADAPLLRAETLSGRARVAAAQNATVGLVRQLRTAGILAAGAWSPPRSRSSTGPLLAAAFLDRGAINALLKETSPGSACATDVNEFVVARGLHALLDRDGDVATALGDLASGCTHRVAHFAASYHSSRSALRSALRVLFVVVVSGVLLQACSWPSTSFALVNVCILAGLSSLGPDTRTFCIGALVATPLAVAAAGAIEFVALDGTDDFPRLAIALLPLVMVSCLLVASGRPLPSSIGFLLNVDGTFLLSPGNPQRYNPQAYLTSSMLVITATILTTLALATVLPTDDARRRVWLIDAIRRDLRRALGGLPVNIEARSFRNADIVGQIGSLAYVTEAHRQATVTHALGLADIAFAARMLKASLPRNRSCKASQRARAALAALDSNGLHQAANEMLAAESTRVAAADAWEAAELIKRNAVELKLARSGALP